MDPNAKVKGLLLRAFRDGTMEPPKWVEVPVADLIVTVAAEPLKGPVGDQTGVRLPVTYREAIEICREMDWVAPSVSIFDAMLARAAAKLSFVALPAGSKMDSIGYTLDFDRRVAKKIADARVSSGALVFGAWKLWILHASIVNSKFAPRGSVNRGFWDPSQRPPRLIQQLGIAHNDDHVDYSQVLQPVKRMARVAATGAEVDLLEIYKVRDRVPARYVDVYRRPGGPRALPGAAGRLRGLDTIDLLATLEAGGVDVDPVAGWEKRTRPGVFAPQGIILHHTAGPKKGNAPSLGICVNGRPDLAGPLCHVLLARNGKAHLVAAGLANHAGKGAKEVLALVKKGSPVVGDAVKKGFADSSTGNAHFYGIEVENTGLEDDPYPEKQLHALARICAALCSVHGWSANRVIHHRQWTSRKPDMSYRGNLIRAIEEVMKEGRKGVVANGSPKKGKEAKAGNGKRATEKGQKAKAGGRKRASEKAAAAAV